jgi:hypothetical protein
MLLYIRPCVTHCLGNAVRRLPKSVIVGMIYEGDRPMISLAIKVSDPQAGSLSSLPR